MDRSRDAGWGWWGPRNWNWSDLKSVLRGVWDQMTVDTVDVLSGGVAFYATLSLFPAIAVMVIVYGMVADPGTLERQLQWMAASIAPSAREILHESITLAREKKTTFGFGALVALLLTTWSASRATNAIILSVQVAYNDTKFRGFLSQLRLNVALTAATLFGGAIILASLAAAPELLTRIGFGPGMIAAVLTLRWPLLLGGFFFGVNELYRLAPKKDFGPHGLLTRPGALVATVAWMVVSAGFSVYISQVDSFGSTYGPAATFAVLMTWLFLSAYVVIVGAEFNAAIHAHVEGRPPSRVVDSDAVDTPTADLPVGPASSQSPLAGATVRAPSQG